MVLASKNFLLALWTDLDPKNPEKQILRSRYPDFWIQICPQGSEKKFTCQNHTWATTIVSKNF